MHSHSNRREPVFRHNPESNTESVRAVPAERCGSLLLCLGKANSWNVLRDSRDRVITFTAQAEHEEIKYMLGEKLTLKKIKILPL